MAKPTPTIPNPAQLAAYRRLLQRLFGERTSAPLPAVSATSPEKERSKKQAKGGAI